MLHATFREMKRSAVLCLLGGCIGHAQFSLEHCRSHMLLEGGQYGVVVHELQIDMQFNQVLNEAED